ARIAAACARVAQREHFGMRLAGPCMPAFADDSAVLHDDAAHTRIGRGGVQAAPRELERARHVGAVLIVRRRHQRRTRFSAAGGASTSFSASRKSDTSWNDR